MSASSFSEELDARLSLALDPFEDMCAPKSQNSIPAFKVTDLSCSCCLQTVLAEILPLMYPCLVQLERNFGVRCTNANASAAARC